MRLARSVLSAAGVSSALIRTTTVLDNFLPTSTFSPSASSSSCFHQHPVQGYYGHQDPERKIRSPARTIDCFGTVVLHCRKCRQQHYSIGNGFNFFGTMQTRSQSALFASSSSSTKRGRSEAGVDENENSSATKKKRQPSKSSTTKKGATATAKTKSSSSSSSAATKASTKGKKEVTMKKKETTKKETTKKDKKESTTTTKKKSTTVKENEIDPNRPWYTIFTNGDEEYDKYMATEWGFEKVCMGKGISEQTLRFSSFICFWFVSEILTLTVLSFAKSRRNQKKKMVVAAKKKNNNTTQKAR